MIDSLKEDDFGVGPVCRVLGWSESAYYARKKRPKSARRLRDEQLMPLIQQVHAESGGTYGARRITRALRRKGVVVARCTVERLMAWSWWARLISVAARSSRAQRVAVCSWSVLELLAKQMTSSRREGGKLGGRPDRGAS